MPSCPRRSSESTEPDQAEGIRRWRVLPSDLPVSGGELTPTLKVRRHLVVERWADLIDEVHATPCV
jgi:long-chain acyl-CoA synthetase